ncbi:3537_t:CDS:2 [Funneliformis caledonium]|uniref:3537_t:CDS:1 n=1 Tax=Funneliformis caledonium TaxID=1117310 RepID=A0A9N9DT97_9GLOM|nr:3537_t:CDS:2 [Funneliformis caledonium]
MTIAEEIKKELDKAEKRLVDVEEKLKRLEKLRRGVEKEYYVGELRNLEGKEEGLEKEKKEWGEEVRKWNELWRKECNNEKEPKHFISPDEYSFKRMCLDEDTPLFKFWKDVQNIEINKKIISLTEGVYLLGEANQGSSIFVRQCYSDLSKIIFDSDKLENFCISGTPVNQRPVFFHQGNIFQGNLDLFDNELNKSDVWYLVDGHHPMKYEAKTILVTSPQKENYRNFQKWAGTNKHFMPVWTWDEISACISKNIYDDSAGSLKVTSKVLYPKVDYEKAKKLFGMWGGIPRVVLQKASTVPINLINQEMEGAIRICDLDMIVKIIGDVVDPKLDFNNKVVHIYTNVPDEEPDYMDNNTMDVCKELDVSSFPPYTQQLVLFASTYVSEKIINRYEEEKRDQLYSFLSASKDQMGYETLRGNIFEAVAHRILRTGGVFETRCLEYENDEIKMEKFPRLENKIFQSIDEINTHNEYYQPQQKNFTSVDSLVLPNMLFQMTINQDHGIKVKGLNDLINILDVEREIKFYFIMPPECFDRMKKQLFHTRKGENSKRLPSWIKDKVKQYVLKVDLASNYKS